MGHTVTYRTRVVNEVTPIWDALCRYTSSPTRPTTIRYNSRVSADPDRTSAALIRRARELAGLTQSTLAERAGTTQSVVSAYEAAARQPSLPMLRRLVEATGLRLELGLGRASDQATPSGSLRDRVFAHRRDITEIARRHGASNVRLFGSVARGDDSVGSDVDLMVDLAPGTGLLTLARLEEDLERLLGVTVDVVPADSFKDRVGATARRDAVTL